MDYDSEGLLLLSDNGLFKHNIIEPKFEHPRTYLVQVERIPTENDLEKLRKGVRIQEAKTKPAKVRMLEQEPVVPPREPPIRSRKSVPTAWLELTIYEGRNRQVRRMTAAIGFPTLRLIRVCIGPMGLGDLKPGEWRELKNDEIAQLESMM